MAHQFVSKKPHYEYLRKKWLSRHRVVQDNLWSKHGQILKKFAAGSLSSLLLLSTPITQTIASEVPMSEEGLLKGYDQNVLLTKVLQKELPKEVAPLSVQEESSIIGLLSNEFGIKVLAEQSGIRLNRNYGLIGGEQHLYRYPGDTLEQHADSASDWAKYGSSGIAPGLGAWGYFVSSKTSFTEKDKLRERYYLAIPTFLSPGFSENVARFRDFFRFRKMFVINPQTGQAVVAVIGDAGPAEWTGKHLGGSPEVMDMLGLANGPRKGDVLYFFIDDPDDKIPLGPVKARTENK